MTAISVHRPHAGPRGQAASVPKLLNPKFLVTVALLVFVVSFVGLQIQISLSQRQKQIQDVRRSITLEELKRDELRREFFDARSTGAVLEGASRLGMVSTTTPAFVDTEPLVIGQVEQ